MKTSKPMAKSPIFPLTLFFVLYSLFFCIACDTGSSTGSKSSGGGETPTARSAGTEKPLTFGTNCKVTIKSSDKFTNAEWTAACNKVAAMIKKAHDNSSAGGKSILETAFAAGNTKMVILGNSFSHNWETKASEPGVLYLKTTSIDSIDFAGDNIIDAMGGYNGHG